MKKLKETASGFIYLEEVKREPIDPTRQKMVKQKPISLEYVGEEARQEASRYFHDLVNLDSGGGIRFGDDVGEARKKLVKSLARILLGEDWDCEEYC